MTNFTRQDERIRREHETDTRFIRRMYDRDDQRQISAFIKRVGVSRFERCAMYAQIDVDEVKRILRQDPVE